MFKSRPRLSRADKLCLFLLSGCFLVPNLAVMALQESAMRSAPADKPQQVEEIVITMQPIAETLAVAAQDAQEPQEPVWYMEDVPIPRELQEVPWEACEANDVPYCIALGLIEVESNFQADADNGVSTGLMQLNRRYFPDGLTPAENIQAGVGYLGELLERYDNEQAALTAYNAGHDTGSRTYAKAVLNASEKWGCG